MTGGPTPPAAPAVSPERLAELERTATQARAEADQLRQASAAAQTQFAQAQAALAAARHESTQAQHTLSAAQEELGRVKAEAEQRTRRLSERLSSLEQEAAAKRQLEEQLAAERSCREAAEVRVAELTGQLADAQQARAVADQARADAAAVAAEAEAQRQAEADRVDQLVHELEVAQRAAQIDPEELRALLDTLADLRLRISSGALVSRPDPEAWAAQLAAARAAPNAVGPLLDALEAAYARQVETFEAHARPEGQGFVHELVAVALASDRARAFEWVLTRLTS